MAVKNIRHVHHDWRPRSLKFAHWRGGGGHVSFAAGRSNASGRTAGLLYGHARAHAFAVLVHLAHRHPVQAVEVDGVKVSGKLGKPDEEKCRVPFSPKLHPDGSVPRPTRPIAWLRWQEGKSRYLAECRVTQASEDSPWMLAAPYAVESDDRRLISRNVVPPGLVFKPGRSDREPFHTSVRIHDLSLVGAGLVVAGAWDAKDLGSERFSGALVDARGRSITTQLTVARAIPFRGGSLLGVAFQSMGLYGIRRLGRWIADL